MQQRAVKFDSNGISNTQWDDGDFHGESGNYHNRSNCPPYEGTGAERSGYYHDNDIDIRDQPQQQLYPPPIQHEQQSQLQQPVDQAPPQSPSRSAPSTSPGVLHVLTARHVQPGKSDWDR